MHPKEMEGAPVMRTTFPQKASLTDRGPAVSLFLYGARRLHGGTSTVDLPENGVRLSSATFIRRIALAVICAA